MNPKSQYVEDQSKQCREHWFKDHVATTIVPVGVEETSSIQIINWQNPKSWNYGCRFIIHRRWLTVVGDIGEAVFEWGEDLTLEFLAALEFSYFLGKCRASDSGRKFEQWDATAAYTDIVTTQAIYKVNGIDELEGIGPSSCRDDYDTAARACYDRTGDAEAASSIASAGLVPSVHAIGMFVGLQMAIKQLKSENPK